LRTERLPEGTNWLYELKLDGYRAIAAKAEGGAHLWSRNEKDFGSKYPGIVKALANVGVVASERSSCRSRLTK
jgi:bifunctional non-homologous end joining protein LigD